MGYRRNGRLEAATLSYYREQESLLKQAQDQYRWLLWCWRQEYAGDGLSHPVNLSRVQARLRDALELEGLLCHRKAISRRLPAKTVTRSQERSGETVEAPASRDTALAMLGAAAEYLGRPNR